MLHEDVVNKTEHLFVRNKLQIRKQRDFLWLRTIDFVCRECHNNNNNNNNNNNTRIMY